MKLMCTLCVATAQLSHCRCRRHMTKLAQRHAEDAIRHMRWASKYQREGEEADQYWEKALGPQGAAWADATS
eukprot:11218297-Lingulodinium_polyedra.AAC.1